MGHKRTLAEGQSPVTLRNGQRSACRDMIDDESIEVLDRIRRRGGVVLFALFSIEELDLI